MADKLSIIEGPDQGRWFEIPQNQALIIGRGSDSDTKIRDPRLSRIHCELTAHDGKFLLTDRGSAAGTFVDAMPLLVPREIQRGDTFRIGDTLLRIESGSSLDASTIRSPGIPTHALTSPRPMHELVGEVLYRYRLDELVASGTSSAVFRAWDQRRERQVALKVLKPQMTSSEQQQDRFIRAMRTMLPIQHPNIVRLRKAGRTGPYCWAAMQWIDGISVDRLLQQIGVGGMMDWKDAWRVAVHIGRALQEASMHHVVHRNITPSNILRRDSDQTYLLSDLIFARALEVTDSAQITRPGDIVGQLPYMAPELLLDPANVDGRSDLYGLGATLYALVTGVPPFFGLTVGDLLDKIRGSAPRSPQELQLGLDERFSDVVMKLLATSPQNRFATPSELLRQLANVGKYGGIEMD
ncbi:Serine/threonine-protein kinase PknB [Rosistilla carotiformis]|uniref:Serine/threonine-protein kinase PknB n=1 Tax=Rosistilla carotiformis TaxID=2528017 RepID=A0A518K1R1_9BACT|nr:FHA domain-containing serine/threonine-protein kinase [Rosistilla carotiformis]QDV71705.1 Serine/threonine-protein kinase PknB [Rosistilla carotiformis]